MLLQKKDFELVKRVMKEVVISRQSLMVRISMSASVYCSNVDRHYYHKVR